MGKATRLFLVLLAAGLMLSGCSVAGDSAATVADRISAAGDAAAAGDATAAQNEAAADDGNVPEGNAPNVGALGVGSAGIGLSGALSASAGGGASPGDVIASGHFEPLEDDLIDPPDPSGSADGDSDSNGSSGGSSNDDSSGSDASNAGAASDVSASPSPAAEADATGDPDESAPRSTPNPGAAGGTEPAQAELLPPAGPGLPPELPAGTIPPAPIDHPLDAKANGFTEKDRKKGSGQTLIGALIIPAIDFRETIVAGADKAAIKKNVGRLGGSSNPGEFGQCVITGHRYYDWGNMFNRLDELVVGDKVDVAMPDGMYYRYIVREVILSEPKPYDLFYPNGKFEMTLVTCHPIHVSTHQLLIRCELQTVVEKDGTQHAPVKPE